MKPFTQTFLVGYSAVVSTVLAGVLLMGATNPPRSEFNEIRVQRIDVVEPDGTLRMVISNKTKLPPVIVKGKERPEMGEPRPQAGMIFYNDEGSENGGLIFGGRKNEKGEVVESGGSLSFDRYGGNQIVQLAGVNDKENQFAGLSVDDGGQSVWIGRKGPDGASVSLTDSNGKKRIVMKVTRDGTASLAFFDADGHQLQELAPNPQQK